MTEEEAKTKWCPMVRSFAENDSGVCATNQDDADGITDDGTTDIERALCKGSQCMMWRQNSTINGYCGLAGKPE